MGHVHEDEEDLKAVLGALAATWGGLSVSLWEVCDDSLRVVCTLGGTSADFELAQRAWRQRGAELRQGRLLRMGESELHPLRGNHAALRGFVQVRQPGSLSAARQALVDVALRQAAGLLETRAPEVELFADVADTAERARLLDERRALVAELDRQRWNYSRVARKAGVTRQTVRNRVLRLRIEVPEWARLGKRRLLKS